MASRQIDIGIITIIEEEFLAVLGELGDPGEIVVGRREYNLFRIDDYDVALVRCLKQGNAEARSVTLDLIADLRPRWLLLVGIAGGAASTEFTLGDVIVSSRFYDFSVEAALQDGVRELSLGGGPLHPAAGPKVDNLQAHLWGLEGWNAPERLGIEQPAVTWTDDALYGADHVRDKVRRVLEHHFGGKSRPPLFRAGHIASSDRLLESTELLAVWQRCAQNVAAIAMELAGVAQAAHTHEIPFVAIRGISDIVGLKRSPAWAEYACRTAAAFAHAFLRTRPCEPRKAMSGASSPGPSSAPAPVPSPALARAAASTNTLASREKALADLLTLLFDEAGLRKWVYYSLARSIYNELPGGSSSFANLVFALVEKALQHGVIDRRFFAMLVEDRPTRRNDIRMVAVQWLPSHEHAAFASENPESAVTPRRSPTGTIPATTPPGSVLTTRPPAVPRAPVSPDRMDTFLLDFRYILDRSQQWSELKALCAEPRAHFTCLLHGDASQDIHLFIERIERYLTGECRQPHQIYELPFEIADSRALTVAEWTQRLCAAAELPAASLEQALHTLAAREPVLLIFGTWPLRDLDEPAVRALTELLDVHLPRALTTSSPSHGVRLLVPIEHEQHATGLGDPLTGRVYEALGRARDAGLPFQELIELDLPSWAELERQLRASLGLTPAHSFLTECKNAYERFVHNPDPHRRSFARLADMLDQLIKTLRKRANHA